MRRTLIIIAALFSFLQKDNSEFYRVVGEFESSPEEVVALLETGDRPRVALVEHCSKHGSNSQRLRALYIKGCYLLSKQEQKDALLCFYEASQLHGWTAYDMKYLALLNMKMAGLFSDTSPEVSELYRDVAGLYLGSIGFEKAVGQEILSLSQENIIGDANYSRKIVSNQTQSKNERRMILFLLLFAVILAAALSLLLVYRKRLKQKTLIIEDITKNYSRYRRNAVPIKELLSSILELSHIAKKDKQKYQERINSITDVSSEGNLGRKLLEDTINNRQGNAVAKFKSDFPSLSGKDYLFFSLIVAGFDATTILVLMDMPSKGSVYTRKSRLKTMIENSGISNKELYLDLLK